MKKKTVSLILASSIVLGTINPVAGASFVVDKNEVSKIELAAVSEAAKKDISSEIKDYIKIKDINVWRGTKDINWKDAVEITGDNQALKEYLKNAKVEDTSNRNADNFGKQKGNLKLTFEDQSELVIQGQILKVYSHATSASEQNVPADAILVKFKLGEGVEAGQEPNKVIGNKEKLAEFSAYKIKPGFDVSKDQHDALHQTLFKLVSPRAIEGYENPTWKSASQNPNNFVVSNENNVFIASAKVKSSAPEDKNQKPAPNPNPDKKDGDKKDKNKNHANQPKDNGSLDNSKNNKAESPKNNNKGLNYHHLNNLSNKNSNTKVVKKDKSSEKNKATYVFNINKDEFEITVNGVTTKAKMYTSPVIRNGRTMLPLRNIAEAIGVEVSWDSKTRTASFTKDGLTASIQIDGDEISYSNGKVVKMDAKPIIKDNRILVSLVNVANIFGLTNGNVGDAKDQDIEWNKDNNTVTIKLQK